MGKISEDGQYYNFNKEFKEECLPELVKIRLFCSKYNIPYHIIFALENNKEDTIYTISKILPPEANIDLTRDILKNIVLATNGFELIDNHRDVCLEDAFSDISNDEEKKDDIF